MKSLKPNTIAILFALIVSTVVTFITLIFGLYIQRHVIYEFIIIFAINFLLIFFIARYVLLSFIQSRLKPIYKIIRGAQFNDISTKSNNHALDLSYDVNDEVKKWASVKQAEIKRLKELEIYRKEFVGNVSHELKTPIFNIQGYIMTLLDGGIDDPHINKLYLKRSVNSVDRMISIVEDLESINRLESGVLKLKKETIDIVKLIDDVFEIELMLAKERKISLEFITRKDKPIKVIADRKRIFEAISNLVVNAIKYGKRGGNVKVGIFDFDDHIVIEIRDNGIGIEKEHLPRIFERFYRVDKHRSREQGGTGLGLSIVKHIIEAHNQSINVKSETDIGTTFTLTLEKAGN